MTEKRLRIENGDIRTVEENTRRKKGGWEGLFRLRLEADDRATVNVHNGHLDSLSRQDFK